MGFLQGDPLPNITETTTGVATTPDYYTNYLTGLSQAGQSALYSQMPDYTAGTPGTLKTSAELIAGYDPLQDTGYAGLEDAAGAYKDTLQSAINTAGLPAGGLQTSRINALMDPYTQNVVKEMERLSQQNVQRQLLPTMKAGFVGSGGLGSQRYAGALGQAMADVQSNLTGQQYGALSKGYSDAMKAALDELRIQNEAAKTQGTLAGQEQEYGLTGAQALIQGGAERQAFEQSKLDAPARMAKEMADVMRGFQVPQSETTTFVGPKAGLYGMSDLQSIMSVLSTLGGIRPDTKEGQSVLGKVLDKVKGLPGASSGSLSNIFDIDWGKYFGDSTILENVDSGGGYPGDVDYSDMLDDPSNTNILD
jgi:hypothetical protein